MEIRIEGLRKTFGGAPAVDDIDLRVREGAMLVLLGPSGCGKTTTMRCVAGLEEPDAGRISIGARAVFDKAARVNVAVNKRRVGMVFQSYAIWPHMTVAENVSYPLDMAKVPQPEKRRRVSEMLETVGLAGLEDRGASFLSGGQMQRVALARSLVMRPDVLLFDEPLSNLDERLRGNLRAQLRELQTRFGITSIYVTHDQREALALADEIAIMRQGRIAQIGDPISVYHRPNSAEIADFLGYCNIFPATIASAGDGACVRAGGALLRSEPAPQRLDIPLSACVRPEDIVIQPLDAADPSGDCVNTVQGEVVLASFLGAAYQYRVRTIDGSTWEALAPFAGRSYRPGEAVKLSVPGSGILLLPRE